MTQSLRETEKVALREIHNKNERKRDRWSYIVTERQKASQRYVVILNAVDVTRMFLG